MVKQHGGDVEQWATRCLVFNVRPLLRTNRPERARIYAVHATVTAEDFAALQASGNPERFIRDAIREKIKRMQSADHVGNSESALAGP